MARTLPRSRFHTGFAAAPETVPHLHDLGIPALPLDGATPADNRELLDRVVRGFRPDLLVAADPFAVHRARDWTGQPLTTLRERYGVPVAGIDRLGLPGADYTADFYGGVRTRLPRVFDACDLVIRTCAPYPPEHGPEGVVTVGSQPSGLHEGGLRGATPPTDDPAGAPRRPTVFLVTSPWEHRSAARSIPAAELVDALPRLVHSHLAALGRPLEVVHVGERPWRFAPAEQIEYRHFGKLPYQMYHERLTSADLFLTTNVLSATLARAVAAGVPALLLDNHDKLEQPAFPDWVRDTAPLLHTLHPYRVAPLGWHDMLEPLLAGNPYRDCFAAAGILDRQAVLGTLTDLLDEGPARAGLRERQAGYRERLAALPELGTALSTAVTR
ncbi:DUF6365 family protein [Streptomyces sp. WI04-05B]|uniref:DUF6365 family protein n=1 Tax=Streptomyces TaxID=1883 RepID=UPI0029B75517|nr:MULTISPECIES: DUF6365 family protein [unclassified Streptomyces]MDX2545378.1 DUF6365 family protein [Streptomyces sp. WI04-05B]MDX2588127.1 DUF6365 family protein [Streptomyces sp. WI04-05A]MDX3749112.1 DUF6365 family protein [Streptomyces sp. AK08-02]